MSAQMKKPKHRQSVLVIYGPQGCGKTTNAKELGKHFNARTVIDDWNCIAPLKPGTVALCQTGKTQGFRTKFPQYNFMQFEHAMDRANLVNTLQGKQPNAIYMKQTKTRLVEMLEKQDVEYKELHALLKIKNELLVKADEKNLRLISDGIERERNITQLDADKVQLRKALADKQCEVIENCSTINTLNSQLRDRSGELCEVMQDMHGWKDRFWQLFKKHMAS